MKRRIAGLLLVPALVGAAPGPGHLEVLIANVRGSTGSVHVDICTEAQFLRQCQRSTTAPAQFGVTRVVFEGLPPGRYAVQVFYDQNGNNRLDRALFGIPREGVGFSNDAPIRFAPPHWDQAAFTYGGTSDSIRLRLRYFIGPSGPGG